MEYFTSFNNDLSKYPRREQPSNINPCAYRFLARQHFKKFLFYFFIKFNLNDTQLAHTHRADIKALSQVTSAHHRILRRSDIEPLQFCNGVLQRSDIGFCHLAALKPLHNRLMTAFLCDNFIFII